NNVANVYVASQSRILQSDPQYQQQLDKYKDYKGVTINNIGGTFTGEVAIEMLKAAGRNLTQEGFINTVMHTTVPSIFYGPVNVGHAKGYPEHNHCVMVYQWKPNPPGGAPVQQRVASASTQCPAFKVPGLG